jgi:hypothetical protein
MKKNYYLIIIEIVWIVTGVLCIAATIRIATTSGGNRIYIFALMAVVSFIFAWIRDRQRRKK